MRQILALASLGLASAYNVSVECAGDEDVKITIDYDKPDMKLLTLEAGDCNNADNATFTQNNETNQVEVVLNMRGCNLRGNSRVSRELRTITFNPTAMIGLGRSDGDRDMFFYTSTVNLTCDVKDDYTVSINYGLIDSDYSGADGIAGGEKVYNFYMKSMNKNFSAEEAPSSRAGDTVYLEIGSTDVEGGAYKFSVLNCVFSENNTANTYNLFNHTENACKNNFLDFTIESTSATLAKANTYRLSHTVFTFDPTRQNDYSLTCDLKLCDYDVASSVAVCNAMETNCDSAVARPTA